MDAFTTLAELGVCRRPLRGFLEIALSGLLSIGARKIEIDNNLVLRNLDVVLLGSVQLFQSRFSDLIGLGVELLGITSLLVVTSTL